MLICSGAPIAFAVEDNSDIQQTIPYILDEPYAFPYQPKTQEWIDLDSYSNRLDACQIPSDILTQISTSALLQTALNYPFLPDIMVFNTFNEGFENCRLKFNGIDELLSRTDLFDVAYKVYSNLDMNLNETADPSKALIQLTFLETLLSQNQLISDLSQKQAAKLADLKEEKFEQKTNYPDIYGITLYTPYIVDGFINSNNAIDKNGMTPQVVTPTPNLCTIKWLYPAGGGKVEAWIVNGSLTTAEYNAALRTLDPHSSATKQGNPTLKYNCHSYAFWDASTTNGYWINSAINFLNGYNSSSIPSVNSRVYYNAAAHSGIVTSVSPKTVVQAKWGSGCLVKSNYDDCPYYSTKSDVTYFTSK